MVLQREVRAVTRNLLERKIERYGDMGVEANLYDFFLFNLFIIDVYLLEFEAETNI